MPHFEFYDPPEAPQQLLRLRAEIAGAQCMLACRRLALLLGKANFNPNQPRVPQGNPSGGQWTGTGSGGGNSARPSSRLPRVPSAVPRLDVRPRGIGDNGGPPLEDPPHIPREIPPTASARNAIIKRAAKWLLKAAARHAIPEIGVYLDAMDAATWLYDSYPYLQAYLDEPKSLDELQHAVSNPQTGYDTHHIVEQTPAENDGFPRSMIDAPDNLVRIPTLKHWEITGWYMMPSKDYNGLSPRAYLRGRGWAERVKIGRKALLDFGVLRP